MSDIISGIYFSLSGFKLVIKPGIRIFLLVPLLINSLLFSIIIIYGSVQIGELVDAIEQQWQWLSWIGWLLWPLFLIIVLTLVFFCFSVVANLIAAPFNGQLSEAVEQYLNNQSGISNQNHNSSGLSFNLILSGIINEIQKFLYIMVRTIPLLILFVVPVLQVAAPIIWIIFAAWIMALEYLDYPLGNHGMEFVEVREQVSINRKVSIGFGLGISFLTIIPIVNFIVMPVAVAGATKLYINKLK
ncbi:MAG: sulfate transporter CysZ [Gammaproteobacteria bacterium]